MDRFREETAADLARNYAASIYGGEPQSADPACCQNCGQPADNLTWLPGWKLNVCPECAAQCRIIEAAEDAKGDPRCPLEYDAILSANTAAEMLEAVRAHTNAPCAHCAAQQQELNRTPWQAWITAAGHADVATGKAA